MRRSVQQLAWILIIAVLLSTAGYAFAAPASEADTGNSTSGLTVYFLDVGQADSSLVVCGGSAMLIDGGNKEDSSLIYSFLRDHGIDHLEYIVCTHPHEDHLGGLAGALNYASVSHALCDVDYYDNDYFEAFETYLTRQNVAIEIPQPGESFMLGSATVEVLGPIYPSDDLNNSSLVLRIVYGDTSFLFTGDAEAEEEESILDSGYDLQSTVLKVGHHGSNSSSSYHFLYEVMPQIAVISVGEGNSYGHPTEGALSRLRDAGATVYRTDMQGDIICTSDGTSVSVTVEKNPDADTLSSVGPNSTQAIPDVSKSVGGVAGTEYVLNTNSLKFHYLDCPSVAKMKDKNKAFFQGSRDEVIAMGYSPCGRCNP